MGLAGGLAFPLRAGLAIGLNGNGSQPGGAPVGPFIVGTTGSTPILGTTTNTLTYPNARALSMLYIFATANMATPALFTLSGGNTGGWSALVQVNNAGATLEVEIWTKVATGGDGMPTFNATVGTVIQLSLAEVGNLVNTADQTGTAIGTTSPQTATATLADAGTGRIVLGLAGQRQLGTVTAAFSDSFNLGTGVVTVIADNGSLAAAHHHHSAICIGSTTGTVADTYVWTQTSGTVNHVVTGLASYH